jgi:phosphate transport system permease protein
MDLTHKPGDDAFDHDLGARQRRGQILAGVFFLATIFGLVVLLALLVDVFVEAQSWLSWSFLVNSVARDPEDIGIWPAIAGSLSMIGLTILIAVPIGVASAVYLEEYAERGWFLNLVQTNIANLAGVPSVIYGILGLALFVRLIALGQSVLAGALTMSLLILPVIIIGTQEALRSLPNGLRESAFALGATRWQVIYSHLLPAAAPGIITGVILAVSRAIGETAPLIVIGVAVFVSSAPDGVLSEFTVLPIQIFDWTARPQEEFRGLAAAGIVVLMAILLTLNLSAVLLRNYFEKQRVKN